jgi:2-keto-3-deoxy-L-fuconate dehydrogenase
MFNLNNKNAIITGGASGIGLDTAKILAKHGAQVYILDINQKDGHEATIQINNNKGKAHFLQCDITKQDTVNLVINQIVANNNIHILINNAGIGHIGNIENTTEEDFDKLYQINIKGTYNCLKAIIPNMKKNGGGVIINMASVASNIGIPDRFAYSMTKGAVKTMTLSIARDYVDYKIRCNCISPGRVHTPFVDDYLKKFYPDNTQEMFEKLSKTQPIGRMADSIEIANLMLYLCSDEASFITGSDFTIDGGFTHLKY